MIILYRIGCIFSLVFIIYNSFLVDIEEENINTYICYLFYLLNRRGLRKEEKKEIILFLSNQIDEEDISNKNKTILSFKVFNINTLYYFISIMSKKYNYNSKNELIVIKSYINRIPIYLSSIKDDIESYINSINDTTVSVRLILENQIEEKKLILEGVVKNIRIKLNEYNDRYNECDFNIKETDELFKQLDKLIEGLNTKISDYIKKEISDYIKNRIDLVREIETTIETTIDYSPNLQDKNIGNIYNIIKYILYSCRNIEEKECNNDIEEKEYNEFIINFENLIERDLDSTTNDSVINLIKTEITKINNKNREQIKRIILDLR